jgi:L-malate glycosyltransferase
LKQLTYFGNKLEQKYGIETVMESLTKGFTQFAKVYSASDKPSYIAKLLDFTSLFFNQTKTNLIIIDVFSTKAFWFAVYLSVLCVVFKKKYVLVLHGGGLPNRFKQSPHIFRWILTRAYKVTAPSMYLTSFFEEMQIDVTFIPNPIRIKDYALRQQTSSINVLKLLYLRGFGAVYQPQLLIEACFILHQQAVSFELHMFGRDIDGTLKQVTDMVEKYHMQSHVMIHGSKPKSDWMQLAQQCAVNLSVPTIDNTPVSVLECMAMGIPTISTNVGGMPHLIAHMENGILVDAEPAAVAEHILMLRDNEALYNKLSTNALEYVKRYDYPNVMEKWKRLIESC